MRACDVVARAVLEDHRVDAAYGEQLGEQQARGPCSDDADLGAHGPSQPPAVAAREPRLPLSGTAAQGRPMPCAATWSAGTRRARSRRMRGTTTPTAAATTRRSTSLHRHGHGARPQATSPRGAGVAATADLGELPAIRPGWTTEWRVSRVSEPSTCWTTSGGAWASSTLPTPVVCNGSRPPTWLTTGTDAWPESRST